jgi:catechol 2,3-dioxygenase-like lactoylglutathione lyase family enzyme
MLNTSKIMAFIPTTDYDKARAFYEGVLGLRVASQDGHAMVLDANGTTIRVTKVQDFQPFPWTILGWQVADIASTVAALRGRGVTFERYGFLEQDDAGVWTAPSGDKVAWFKDPNGNTLSVSQHV